MFQSVALVWGGETYTIPSEKVMGAIAIADEHVTLMLLQQMLARPVTLQLPKVAAAYAAVLAYAGAKGVTVEAVYVGMFGANEGSALKAILALQEMMIPESVKKAAAEAGDRSGEA